MTSKERLVFAAVVASVSVYLFLQNDQGWIAHDEGLLGQSATRVLEGQLPHVDFDDPYTGGLAMFHAATMRVLGVSSGSLRIGLLIASIIASALTYLIARRFASPPVSALLTWLAIAWGVPNYFAPLPSWFNLYLAIGGTWALIKYDESDRRRWLIAAGVCVGLSFLVKISGLYLLAAGLLFLVYREQCDAERIDSNAPTNGSTRSTAFFALTTLCLVGFVFALLMIVRRRLTVMDSIHFVLPGSVIAGLLIVSQFRTRGSSWVRLRRLTLSVGWLVAGAAIPVVLFLSVIAFRSGTTGLGMFFEGVFILPQKRIEFADYPLPPLRSLVATIPIALLLVLPMLTRANLDSLWLIAIGWIGCITMWIVAWQSPFYEAIWASVRTLIPVVVVVGCVVIGRRGVHDRENRTLFLILSVASMVSLVQFPYSFPIYFCYAAGVGVLAVAALLQASPNRPRQLWLIMAVFYLGFAILYVNQSRVQRIGISHVPDDQFTLLDLPRSGLRVSASQADLYERVVNEVQQHSGSGDFIYATKDCPEIYFLAARRNPTRSFYDFFEPDFAGDDSLRADRIMRMLDVEKVNVVVLHWRGEFSGTVSQQLAERLVARYPNAVHFLRDPIRAPDEEPVFSVAWREPSE